MFYWLTVAMVLISPWQVEETGQNDPRLRENSSYTRLVVVEPPAVEDNTSDPMCCGPEPPPPPPPPKGD